MKNTVYSSKFEIAISTVLGNEGGYNDIPQDKGGATRYGISLRFLQQHKLDLSGDGIINDEDIKLLTLDKAKEIYHKYFWDNDFESIEQIHTCAKLFDMTVNMGKKQAVKILQRALKACGKRYIVDDGIIGAKTLQAIHISSLDGLKAATKAEQAAFYRYLVAKDPSQNVFLNGWLNRAYKD